MVYVDQRRQCFLFPVVLTPPLPSHHDSVWLLSVIFHLTNTVSRGSCRLAYQNDWRGFMGAKKKTSMDFLYLTVVRLARTENKLNFPHHMTHPRFPFRISTPVI
jgi:hypothetical protein